MCPSRWHDTGIVLSLLEMDLRVPDRLVTWWLNLKAHPDAVVRLAHEQSRPVRGRVATGEERDRMWARWAAVDVDLDAYATSRSVETPVVVFEPRSTVVREGAGNATEIRAI
jgi:hypothetical protein